MSSPDDIDSHSDPPPPPPPAQAPQQQQEQEQQPQPQEQRHSTASSSLETPPSSQQKQQQHQHASSGQKRRRFPVSCFECRRRKLKCDREQPCQRCRSSRRECVYANESPAAKVPKLGAHHTAPRLYGENYVEDLRATGQRFERTSNVFPPTDTKATTMLVQPQQHAFDRQERYEPITSRFSTAPADDRVEQQQVPQQTQLPQIQYLNNGIGHDFMKRSPAQQHQVPISCLLSAPGETCGRSSITDRRPVGGFASEEHKGEHHSKGKPFTRGKNAKIRYFGRSHVSSLLTQFDGLRCFIQEAAPFNPSIPQVRKEFAVWKERLQEREEAEDLQCMPNLLDNVPESSVEADGLVRTYMKMFESTHRILHIPSFWTEYREFWRDKTKAAPEFVAQLLLIMAAGLLFQYQSPDSFSLNKDSMVGRQTAVRWVHAVEGWLSHRQRPDLTLIRIHCLLILAKRVNAIDTDMIWTSVGTLVRLAMTMGLHRDPDYLQKISIFHAECRRRLWATILELDLQASMERGMPMMIGHEDHDCRAPLNINDWDIMESTEITPSHPPSVTETSFQVTLLQSLPVRLEIAKLTNNLHPDPGPSYEEILRLDKEITQCLQDIPHNLKIETNSKVHIEAGLSLPKQLLDLHIRRYLLLLHVPFAVQAGPGGDPRYSYSRHVCLENASVMLSHYKAFPDTMELRALLFKDEHAQAALSICFELFINKPNAGLGLSKDMYHIFRDSSLALVESTLQLFEKRISILGKGVKDYFFLSMVSAFVKAKESPEFSERYMRQSADRCARVCTALSLHDLASTPTVPADERVGSGAVSAGGDALTGLGPLEFDGPDFSIDDMEFGYMALWDADYQAWA